MQYWQTASKKSCPPWSQSVSDALNLWISRVEARLLSWRLSQQVVVVYAETGHRVAQYRIRVTLLDGSLLQCVERIRQLSDGLHTEKYSFHWQRTDGSLIRRWDNAPHHPEISSFPHHVHDHAEDHVLPHDAVDVFLVLECIEAALSINASSG